MTNENPKFVDGFGTANREHTAQDKPPEMRDAQRVSLLIRTAKLVAGGQDILCIIRNISASGTMVRAFLPIPDCDSLTLELENGERHDVEVIWNDGEHAGLQFRTPVDVNRFIDLTNKPYSKRPIRLRSALDAEIRTATENASGQLLNISQTGARIQCAAHLSIDQRVRLAVAGMPLIAARVRWRRAPNYGLSFENAFRLDELGELLALHDMVRKAGGQ